MSFTKADSQLIVLFGASGDLTSRKLIPALIRLFDNDLISQNTRILGVGRSLLSNTEFALKVLLQNEHLADDSRQAHYNKYADRFLYFTLSKDYLDDYGALAERVYEIDQTYDLGGRYLFYCSTPPNLYESIAERLKNSGLLDDQEGDTSFRKLVVEKPFGYSLETAKSINEGLHRYFNEEQIYRIDHYLGKETVQNLLVTRFSNSIFEPLWNSKYIERVEITNAESDGVALRGGYYDHTGALRDMFQNHLLQLVSLVVMEPPQSENSEDIRNEKVKALEALRPLITSDEIERNTLRGQYTASRINGELVEGYREEQGVSQQSFTETYAAVRFFVDNERWKGTPFYVRTAKRMPTTVTEIVIFFKRPEQQIFQYSAGHSKKNILVIRIQPNEGILLKFGVKQPGQGFKAQQVNMDFYYDSCTDRKVLQAYERLLLDALNGDATLYARAEEVEKAWEFVDPIIAHWNSQTMPMHGYPAGTWGPKMSNDFIEGPGYWRNPGEHLNDDENYCVISS